MRAAALCLLAAVLSSGCGYRVAGQADLLPDKIHTIAVPAFENGTTRYRLTQSLPAAIAREFISRTRYQVVHDEQTADAVLRGAVVNYYSYPAIFDGDTGRATGIQMIIVLSVNLVERESGKTLFERSGQSFQNRYEISTDQVAYFEESNAALDRLSGDVARTLVSAILEDF